MIMATYETFAAVYDAVMDDSLYDLWTDFSLRHLPKTKDKKKLLELACGTGIQSVRFSQAGFDVTGLDLSADNSSTQCFVGKMDTRFQYCSPVGVDSRFSISGKAT